MSNRNGAVRFFGGGINSAAYWVGTTLLSASHVLNDSSVTGTTVKDALNYLSTSSTAVFPFVASGLAEQDLVSYDASAATWRNRTKAAALRGSGTDSIELGTASTATQLNAVALGRSAQSLGVNCLALGSSATTGANSADSAIGPTATANGGSSTAVGNQASATGASSTALGRQTNSSGPSSVSIGISASTSTQSGVAIGNLAAVSTAVSGVAIGPSAAASGASCVTIGLSSIASGSGSVTVGRSSTSSGTSSTAIGDTATASATDSIAIGHNASATASNSIAIGNATVSNSSDNTFVGNTVGNSSVGSRNTSFGSQAFNSASAAVTDVVVLGYNALTAILSTTAPSGSVAIGSTALQAATTGFNSAVGFAAGLLLTIGTGNALFGANAGDTLTTGNNNTILGHNADVTANSRSGTVVIGTGASAAADDTLVIRMGNTSTKEIVVTPVVTSTPVSTVSNLPLTVGGTSYTIPLGPASYAYTSTRTTDEVLAVNGTTAATSLTNTVPAGTYKFDLVSTITHSTISGGAVTMLCSEDTTTTYVGQSTLPSTGALTLRNISQTTAAGTDADLIYDAGTTDTQYETCTGTLTCAASTTFTIRVYSAAAQNITVGQGSSFTLTRI